MDDLREVMAYYKIQADDRAHEQWKAKIDELHKQRGGRTMPGALNTPQAPPR